MTTLKDMIAGILLVASLAYLAWPNPAGATVEVSPITGGTVTTLTDAATITWPANQGYAYLVTLGGNRTFANPSDQTIGALYTLVVVQDATGSRTLTWGTNYRFPAAVFSPTLPTSDAAVPPSLSTGAATRTLLTFWSDGTYMHLLSATKDIQGRVVPPSSLTATDNVAGRVNLAWTDNSTDETAFEIWRADESAEVEKIATVGPNVLIYADLNGEPDPGRAYYVRAVRGFEKSAFSNFAVGFEP